MTQLFIQGYFKYIVCITPGLLISVWLLYSIRNDFLSFIKTIRYSFLSSRCAYPTDDTVVEAVGVALGECALIAFRGDSPSSSSGWYALLRLLDDGAGGGRPFDGYTRLWVPRSSFRLLGFAPQCLWRCCGCACFTDRFPFNIPFRGSLPQPFMGCG